MDNKMKNCIGIAYLSRFITLSSMSRSWYHEPVLLQEVLDRVPEEAQTIMDGTLGHGGHTQAILSYIIAKSEMMKQSQEGNISWDLCAQHCGAVIVWVDRDATMLQKAKERLSEFGEQVQYVHGSYATFKLITQQTGMHQFDMILLDLGVNMEHFKDAERGFSIKKDWPLDMRFDTSDGIPANERLNICTPEQFHETLEKYTDFSPKRMAHMEQSFFASWRDFSTTAELRQRAKSIGTNEKALAIFFQAIRISVNRELQELTMFLHSFPEYLTPNWRCIILTYHSGEDRMVKESFKQRADQWVCTILTKHVIAPQRSEKEHNPAARSAKMRVIQKGV